MFRETKAFSGFSVNDLAKARRFYGETLQIEITELAEMNVLQLHVAGSNALVIYEKADHRPASFTILNFPVSDVKIAVEKLKALGVTFESYDWPGFKTDADHIFRGGGPLIAWFTDPAGNILSVIQEEE
ncbi:VOC family protein [Dyadobacter sp. LHD-138]|uniref:VOC family protein n=1 Tax=Dyadobacter sp. LHD-138 TaxID=3071413 RepID=UPI0027DFE498|nr:VOC family protein [Dyadobacter sp. LHD-138]MDQ6481393.1 VOC family protein [Dyadobacter sp. LHD-138]